MAANGVPGTRSELPGVTAPTTVIHPAWTIAALAVSGVGVVRLATSGRRRHPDEGMVQQGAMIAELRQWAVATGRMRAA